MLTPAAIQRLLSPRYNAVSTVAEKIKQRRTQMFLHSFLYYGLDMPRIDDATFDKWARELVKLHKTHHFIGFYDNDFLDWNGSTGCHLKPPGWIMDKVKRHVLS